MRRVAEKDNNPMGGTWVFKLGWLNNRLILWAGALLMAVLYFYALDHFIMAIQGLPLNLDLSPAQ